MVNEVEQDGVEAKLESFGKFALHVTTFSLALPWFCTTPSYDYPFLKPNSMVLLPSCPLVHRSDGLIRSAAHLIQICEDRKDYPSQELQVLLLI